MKKLSAVVLAAVGLALVGYFALDIMRMRSQDTGAKKVEISSPEPDSTARVESETAQVPAPNPSVESADTTPASAPPSTVSPVQQPRAAPVPTVAKTPEERLMRDDGRMDLDEMSSLMTSAGYQELMEFLRLDMKNDPSQATIASLYSQQITDLIAEGSSQARVSEVACGRSVCAVTLRDAGPRAAWPFQVEELERMGLLPSRARSQATVSTPDGGTALRMVFATDPATRPFRSGLRRPGRP